MVTTFLVLITGCGGSGVHDSSVTTSITQSILIAAPQPGTYDFIRTADRNAHFAEVVTTQGSMRTVTDRLQTAATSQYEFDDQRGLFLVSLTSAALSCTAGNTLPLVLPRRAWVGLTWSGTYDACTTSTSGTDSRCLLSVSGRVAGTRTAHLDGHAVLLVDLVLETKCTDRAGEILLASTAHDDVEAATGVIVRRTITSGGSGGVLADDVKLAGLDG